MGVKPDLSTQPDGVAVMLCCGSCGLREIRVTPPHLLDLVLNRVQVCIESGSCLLARPQGFPIVSSYSSHVGGLVVLRSASTYDWIIVPVAATVSYLGPL
jgi:hypothetical protein